MKKCEYCWTETRGNDEWPAEEEKEVSKLEMMGSKVQVTERPRTWVEGRIRVVIGLQRALREDRKNLGQSPERIEKQNLWWGRRPCAKELQKWEKY